MKIVLELPTNSWKELQAIRAIAEQTVGEDICWAIFLNGDEFSVKDELATTNLLARFGILAITDPCVSMTELRLRAHAIGEEFAADFRIWIDGDFEFKRDWIEFIQSACIDMERFRSLSGKDCYLSMGTSFGDVRPFRTTRVSQHKFFFATDCGIIMPKVPLISQLEILPGGFEEGYLTAFWFCNGLVPLIKRNSPLRHKKADIKATFDDIHSREIWFDNNERLVRELFADESWRMNPYNFRVFPRRQRDKLLRLCDELSTDTRMHEFFSSAYLKQRIGF